MIQLHTSLAPPTHPQLLMKELTVRVSVKVIEEGSHRKVFLRTTDVQTADGRNNYSGK